ncbi:MAG: DUF6799 domain-containing protein [Verrucomicrobiota bacterium]
MKSIAFRVFVLVQFFLAGWCVPVFAQGGDALDGVICLTNRSLLRQGATLSLLGSDLALPGGVVVLTNGTFTVGGGAPRSLQEGQVLRRDGFLLSSDGTIVPVCDHLVMMGQSVMVYRDGQVSALTSPMTFPDGAVLNPDGSYVRNDRRSRLIDGQMVTLSGESLPGYSSILMKNGQVAVFKGAALLPVESNVIRGMYDGTKVRGDGLVTFHDNTTLQMTNGQVLLIPGIRGDW